LLVQSTPARVEGKGSGERIKKEKSYASQQKTLVLFPQGTFSFQVSAQQHRRKEVIALTCADFSPLE